MKIYKFSLAIIASLFVYSSQAQLPDSLQKHIDSAFNIMQHSLYSNNVNWALEKTIAYEAAKNAANKKALFPILAAVYKKLDDHHGWFEQYDDKIRLPSTDNRLPSDNMKKEWAKGPAVVAKMINGYAYLRLPGMHVYSQKQIDHCANWLADSVRSLAAQNPKGWIIDLRLNTGGHTVPMMAGLASFFNEGPISYYLDKNKKVVSHAVIRNGQYILEDTVQAQLKAALPALQKARVAVLIGRGTGSSGEGVAFNFKYRSNTKLFGENSAGLANATEGFVYNNDQTYLLITTSILGNKNKKALPMLVKPGKYIVPNDLFETIEADNAVIAAVRWLGK